MADTDTLRSGPGSDPTAAEIDAWLRRRIHGGELGPGDRLPPERDLAATLGVGRVRVREALASLESDGYVVARRGVGGGRFVTGLERPWHAWARRMARRPEELDELVDYRIALEQAAARLAARRRTAEDLTDLRRSVALLEASSDPTEYRLADAAFHRALAGAAHNRRLAEAVEAARGELFGPVDEVWCDNRAEQSLVEHRRVLHLIERGDSRGAARSIADHIETTRAELHDLLGRPQTET